MRKFLLYDLPILPLCCDRHIFGTAPEGDDEDENRPPTIANTIRAKRAARKAANNHHEDHDDQTHHNNDWRGPAPPLSDRQNIPPLHQQ